MSEVLDGTPDLILRRLKARYEPLRDSRAHSEPELHQRKILRGTAYLLLAGGLGLPVLLVALGEVSAPGVIFGLVVAAIGIGFWQQARKPLAFTPPEPLENLAALSQGLGLCQTLIETFPTMRMELDPIAFTAQGSCDGYDWQLKVDRESLKPMPRSEVGYETYMASSESGDGKSGAGRVWNRPSSTVKRHRIAWTVTVAGDFTPKPGQPSQHTSLEHHEGKLGNTLCVFTLPLNHHDKPGLGHDNRTDFISSPMGLHHPEFVGEQIAQSLVWMFKPRL